MENIRFSNKNILITVIIGNNGHYLKSNNNEFSLRRFLSPVSFIQKSIALVQLNENYHRINVNCSHNVCVSVNVLTKKRRNKEQIQASLCIYQWNESWKHKNWPSNRIICAFYISIASFTACVFILFCFHFTIWNLAALGSAFTAQSIRRKYYRHKQQRSNKCKYQQAHKPNEKERERDWKLNFRTVETIVKLYMQVSWCIRLWLARLYDPVAMLMQQLR